METTPQRAAQRPVNQIHGALPQKAGVADREKHLPYKSEKLLLHRLGQMEFFIQNDF